MNLTLTSPPEIEPISLTQIKQFLRLDTIDSPTTLQTEQSIKPAAYAPSTVNGISVDVLGYVATIHLDTGTVLATGTLNVTIQHSNDNATWETFQAFAQVTPANDDQSFEIQYTGDKQYLRAVAVIANVNASFSVSIILSQGYTIEDDYLSALITAARQYCEDSQNRAYITQTWELAFDYWPGTIIDIPKGNLQTIDSVKYKNSAGVITTLAATTGYVYSARGLLGRLTPAYGKSWPSFTAYPLDAVVIEFMCGYGDTAADVPMKVIQAMKLLISHWYENRLPLSQTMAVQKEIEFTVSALLWQDKIVNI